MVTTAELQRRGLRYAVSVDAAATNASLLDLQQKGLPYAVEVADGATMASRAALEARGLAYFVPVLVDATPASKASLERQGLRYAVQVDADILPADRLVLDRQGLRYLVKVDSSGNSVAAGGAGGAAIIAGETNAFATDFTYATDASRVAVKTAGVNVSSGLDAFYQNAGTSPKLVWDASGALVWSPHNLIFRSEDFTLAWGVTGSALVTAHTIEDTSAAVTAGVSQNITAIVGATYVSAFWFLKDAVTSRFPAAQLAGATAAATMINTSTGAIANVGAMGMSAVSSVVDEGVYWKLVITYVADQATVSQRIYAAYGTVMGTQNNAAVGICTVDKTQANRGSTLTAYLPTLTAVRCGLAVDYDPVTHSARGLLCELAATNILLNSTTLSTQSVTVSAVAYTLSFLGTGTVTLSGVSSAGPLVGTGASNLVSLTFTPTAGSLTLTVTGTVSNAQLETGTIATSRIQTFGASATRAADNYTFLLSTIPALGSEYSIYVRFQTPVPNSGQYIFSLNNGTSDELAAFNVSTTTRLIVNDNAAGVGLITGPTLVANTPTSVAGRFKLNDCAMSVGGAAVGTDVVVTMPTPTAVRFANAGTTVGSTTVANIEKVAIVMPAWNDATLVTKSAT
jgi:hypothetical protein